MKIDASIKYSAGTSSSRAIPMTEQPSKIIFNNVEYESLDDMPTYARDLYEQTMDAGQEAGRGAIARNEVETKRSPEPEASFLSSSLLISIVIAAVGYLWYLLMQK